MTKIEELVVKIKEVKGILDQAETEMVGLKEQLLMAMKQAGVPKVDASAKYGLKIDRTFKTFYHYDESRVENILGERLKEVISIDKKKVDKLIEELPSLKEARIIDSQTEYLVINKAKGKDENRSA